MLLKGMFIWLIVRLLAKGKEEKYSKELKTQRAVVSYFKTQSILSQGVSQR